MENVLTRQVQCNYKMHKKVTNFQVLLQRDMPAEENKKQTKKNNTLSTPKTVNFFGNNIVTDLYTYANLF